MRRNQCRECTAKPPLVLKVRVVGVGYYLQVSQYSKPWYTDTHYIHTYRHRYERPDIIQRERSGIIQHHTLPLLPDVTMCHCNLARPRSDFFFKRPIRRLLRARLRLGLSSSPFLLFSYASFIDHSRKNLNTPFILYLLAALR